MFGIEFIRCNIFDIIIEGVYFGNLKNFRILKRKEKEGKWYGLRLEK